MFSFNNKNCHSVNFYPHQLINSNVMKDVVRNSLFPTADMVISMSREFGVPITQEDFDGR